MLFVYPALLPKDVEPEAPKNYFTKTKTIGHGSIRVIGNNTLDGTDAGTGEIHDYGDGYAIAPYIFTRRAFTSTELAETVDTPLTETSIADFLVYGDNDFNIQGIRYKSPMFDFPFIVDYSRATNNYITPEMYIGLNTRIRTDKVETTAQIRATYQTLDRAYDVSEVFNNKLTTIKGTGAKYVLVEDLLSETTFQTAGTLKVELIDTDSAIMDTPTGSVIQTALFYNML
jgi:hypothetical protein